MSCFNSANWPLRMRNRNAFGLYGYFFCTLLFFKKNHRIAHKYLPCAGAGIVLVLVAGAVYAGSDVMILLSALLSVVVLLVMNKKIWMATTKYIIKKIRSVAVTIFKKYHRKTTTLINYFISCIFTSLV